MTIKSNIKTAGEKLVDLLADYGVDTVFGIPGTHSIELYRGLESGRIRHVSPRHEQGGGFMADGYARVTGKPGVCFVITGPGVTNITTPAAVRVPTAQNHPRRPGAGTVVTGTGPHAGDEDVRRFGFDISDVTRVHSLTVIAAAVAVVGLVVALGRAGERRRFESTLSTWMFVALVQGGIGYVQYFNGVPELLVGAHLAGATLLWVVTVQLLLDGLTPGASRPDLRPAPAHDDVAVPA